MIDCLTALLYPLRSFAASVTIGDLQGVYACAVYIVAAGVLGFGITMVRRFTNV